MKPERLFLKHFVSSFYDKSRKVRTPKNAAVVIDFRVELIGRSQRLIAKLAKD